MNDCTKSPSLMTSLINFVKTLGHRAPNTNRRAAILILGAGKRGVRPHSILERNVEPRVGMLADALLIVFISFCTAFLSEGKTHLQHSVLWSLTFLFSLLLLLILILLLLLLHLILCLLFLLPVFLFRHSVCSCLQNRPLQQTEARGGETEQEVLVGPPSRGRFWVEGEGVT